MSDARVVAHALRQPRLTTCLRASSTSCPSTASCASGSARRAGTTDARRRAEYAPREHPALSTGDSVRHQTMGEGVVTGIDAGGVITVRFEDGSERRLMLDYAPLEKISA